MKKVIVNDIVKTIAVAKLNNSNTYDCIVCYVTAGNNGLGILQKMNENHYGFRYHKNMVFDQRNDNLTFIANNAQEAIKRALDSGREVLIFDDFDEFLTFSSNYTTY